MSLKDYTILRGFRQLPIPDRFKGWLVLLRPYTLLAPLLGGLAAISLSGGTRVLENWSLAVHGLVSILLVAIASTIQNQSYEAEADALGPKRIRPIPSGLVSKEEANLVSMLLYLVALARAGTLGIWEFPFFLSIIAGATILYNLPPVHLKAIPLASNGTIAIARLLGFIAAWSLFSTPWSTLPWLLGIPLGVYFLGATELKNLSDDYADRQAGVRTLVNTLGVERAMAIALFPMLFAWVPLVFLGLVYVALPLMALSALAVWLGAKTQRYTFVWGLGYAVVNIYFLSLIVVAWTGWNGLD